jgi:hypothetical protein
MPVAGYRETRPVHGGSVATGAAAGLVWFLLVGAVAWSPVSYVVATTAGVLPALIAAFVLLGWGNRGAGIGVGITTCAAVAFLFVLLATW